ncbi:MAG: hypothetical protein ABI042_00040 [Verrucomicrobiota bacterium]
MKSFLSALLLFAFFNQIDNARAQAYSFSTIAGAVGMSGTADGTNAAARLSFPTGMAVDTNGNVYFADRSGNSAIRKMTRDGTNWIVTTIAGSSAFGFRDGTNSGAIFNTPGGVALDKAGNLYVADVNNHCIRKMVPDGTNWIVTTIAGGGTAGGYVGLQGAADGTNRSARFFQPVRVAVDSETNIYVADYLNNAVRKVVPDGTNWVTTTIAGVMGSGGNVDATNNSARFRAPNGTAFDSAGNLYVSDAGSNNTLRKLTPDGTNWVVTTIATGFSTPACVAIDRFDNIFVADVSNHRIKKLTSTGTDWIVTSIGGNGISGSADGVGSAAQFNRPDGVAVDAAGNVYVGDSVNRTMRLGKPLPALQLSLANGQTILSWGIWPTNFVLESTGDFSPTHVWSLVNAHVETTNQQNSVTLPTQTENSFFRLKQF